MAGQVRQPIDEQALEKYIRDNVPAIQTPIELKQFGYGQSNPTYQITDAAQNRFVMRKKPPGKLLSPTAHQVEREHRVLAALRDTPVPVPRVLCLCEDPRVVGTPFYVMEFLDGRIFTDFLMPGLAPAERTALWREAARTLARLHAVDVAGDGAGSRADAGADAGAARGLRDFGKHGGFYPRQVRTWARIQGDQARAVDVQSGEAVGPLPCVDEIVRFFADEAGQPRDRVTLVHGDYKIDNLVFHKTEPRVIGILDWEMSTIGHPLSDVANLLAQFSMSARPDAGPQDTSGFQPGRTPGLPTADQMLGWYAEVAGYDPRPDMPWGAAFTVFRLAVVVQGIAARYAARQASSANAKEWSAKRNSLGKLAWALAQDAMAARGDKARL
ncbi:Acyl-CoA dehydrogenase family member 10 [Escovopsis weberi]|uniref:Acyl-CoA dehydrogenase family member 10 n=1 Tax=Escovopsis weberi TaxID=150374 RepID=A0A0N0RT86_ESCWE|nr:Acyl-CoA dehydrogenase family member 10 [Escovopsis weberi]